MLGDWQKSSGGRINKPITRTTNTMKPIKIASLALMGALAFGNYSVAMGKGGPDFMKLSVSLVVQYQDLYATNLNGDGKTYVWTVEKRKLNNEALLTFMAEMFNTNWPADARLMYSMYDRQVVVADATGTNVLFYCTEGVSDTNRVAFVDIDWYEDYGPIKGKTVEGPSGVQEATAFRRGTIVIHYENFSDETVYTDLAGDGLNVEKISAEGDAGSYTVSVKDNLTPFALGSIGAADAIMTGKVTAKGKGTFVVKTE
jgi:hypothetical protein